MRISTSSPSLDRSNGFPESGRAAAPARTQDRTGSAAPVNTGWEEERIVTQPGLFRYGTLLNQQLTTLQQAQSWLSDFGLSLDMLRAAAGKSLNQPIIDSHRLKSNIERTTQAWQRRSRECEGVLDVNLRVCANGSARQQFGIKGLNAETLLQPRRESLIFTTSLRNARVMPVIIKDNDSAANIMKQLNNALNPTGIHAWQDAQGQVLFSIPEKNWLAFRQSISIQGGGIRFPAGRPSRANLEIPPALVTPGKWRSELHSDLRELIRDCTHIRNEIDSAQKQLATLLSSTGNVINDLGRHGEAEWANNFAKRLNAMMTQFDDFSTLSQLAGAVGGQHRYAVLNLLAID